MKRRFLLVISLIICFITVFSFEIMAQYDIKPDVVEDGIWYEMYSVRLDDPKGLRFYASIDTELRGDEFLEEYGFVITRESFIDEKGIAADNFGFESDVVKVSGVCYGTVNGEIVDKYVEKNDSTTVFAAVLCNFSDTMLSETLIARPYTKYDGEYVYGPVIRTNLFNAAERVRDSSDFDNLSLKHRRVILNIIEKHNENTTPFEEIQDFTVDPVNVRNRVTVFRNDMLPRYMEDEDGTTFYYVPTYYLGKETCWLPVAENSTILEICGEKTAKIKDEYLGKLCFFAEDEEGFCHFALAKDLFESDDITVLDGSADYSKMFYVDTMPKTSFYNIVGSRYDIGIEKTCNITGKTRVIARFYYEDSGIYEYKYLGVSEIEDLVKGLGIDVVENASFILSNNTDTKTRDNLLVAYFEVNLSKNPYESFMRIVSSSSIGSDDDGKIRYFYDLYNPQTGEKETEIPGKMYWKKYSQAEDALEEGTIIELDEEYVDDEYRKWPVMDRDKLVWIVECDDAKNKIKVIPADESLKCKKCIEDYILNYESDAFSDIYGENQSNSIGVDGAYFSCISNKTSKNIWKSANIFKTTIDDIVNKEKELLCYNDNHVDANGKYKKGYADYVKAYIALNATGYKAEYVIVEATGNDNAALDEVCEYHKNDYVPEIDTSIRIVSVSYPGMDDEGMWRHFYSLYNPLTGNKEYDICSFASAEKASKLEKCLEIGTIIKLDDNGLVNTEDEYILGSMTKENLVWIKSVKNSGEMVVVPAVDSGCKECTAAYVDEYSEGEYRDCLGNIHASDSVYTGDYTAFSIVKRFRFKNLFNDGNISKISYSDIMAKTKNMLCYNDLSLDQNNKYVRTYADYVKAFVLTDEHNKAIFVMVVAVGEDDAAYNGGCSNCAATLTQEYFEEPEIIPMNGPSALTVSP